MKAGRTQGVAAGDLPAPEWVDEVVVRRVVLGCDPGRRLTQAERRAVARSLAGRYSITAIAKRLGASSVTVRALLAEHREEQPT